MDDFIIQNLIWEPPPRERIVSLCQVRDKVLMATDRGLYLVEYSWITCDCEVKKLKSTEE